MFFNPVAASSERFLFYLLNVRGREGKYLFLDALQFLWWSPGFIVRGNA